MNRSDSPHGESPAVDGLFKAVVVSQIARDGDIGRLAIRRDHSRRNQARAMNLALDGRLDERRERQVHGLAGKIADMGPQLRDQ